VPEILYITVAVGACVSKMMLSIYHELMSSNASLSVIETILTPSPPDSIRDLLAEHPVQIDVYGIGPVPFL